MSPGFTSILFAVKANQSFQVIGDFRRLDPADAELLLSTLEWGGKGSNPDKAKWFKSPLAKSLLGRNDWMDLPKAMKGERQDVQAYILLSAHLGPVIFELTPRLV